jgi:hypothetical protein
VKATDETDDKRSGQFDTLSALQTCPRSWVSLNMLPASINNVGLNW